MSKPTEDTMPDSLLLPCDVTKQEEVDETFKRVGEEFGRLDFLIHSIAYAPREALDGEFLATSREAFQTALEISAYSLTQLARAATPLMTEGGSIVTMTYYGAEKSSPVQRDGRGQGRARTQRALSRQRSRSAQHSHQRHQRRSDSNALGAWRG